MSRARHTTFGSQVSERWRALAVCTALGAALCIATPTLAQSSNEGGVAEASGDATATGADPTQVDPPANAQAPQVGAASSVDLSEATLSAQQDVYAVAVGEPFAITLDLAGASSATPVSVRAPTEPHLQLTLLSAVTEADGRQTLELEAVLYRPGTFRIASLNATLLDASGAQATVESGPLAIEVASSIINEPDAEPLGSPRPFPVLTTNYLPVILGSAILLLLLGGLLGVMVRRRREAARLAAVPPPPPPPAWETALGALAALEHSTLLDEDRHLDFHMRLSEIFRAYIGDRFNVLAIEATTEEIRAALRARADHVGEWEPEIMRMLNEMDVVKFAKGAPTHEQSDELLLKTREFVLELSARLRDAALESNTQPTRAEESQELQSDQYTSNVPQRDDHQGAVPRSDEHEAAVPRSDEHEAAVQRSDEHEAAVPRSDEHEAAVQRSDEHEEGEAP